MNDIYKDNPVRIPVKLVSGRFEYLYGGDIYVADGAVGDLIVDRSAIRNEKFLASLKRVTKHKVLDEGTRLLVALTIKPSADIEESLRRHLKHRLLSSGKDIRLGDAYYFTPRSGETQFVEISISKPTASQMQRDPTQSGGVWLHVEGLQPKGISSSVIVLPEGVWNGPVDSLNHAFTLLSECYEPWRKSHTGNIYDRMLYEENNGKWYPLNVLREAAISKDEHQLIRTRWAEIAKAIGLDSGGGQASLGN